MNNLKQEIIPILRGFEREVNYLRDAKSDKEIDYDWYAEWIVEKSEQYYLEQEECKCKFEDV